MVLSTRPLDPLHCFFQSHKVIYLTPYISSLIWLRSLWGWTFWDGRNFIDLYHRGLYRWDFYTNVESGGFGICASWAVEESCSILLNRVWLHFGSMALTTYLFWAPIHKFLHNIHCGSKTLKGLECHVNFGMRIPWSLLPSFILIFSYGSWGERLGLPGLRMAIG